MKKVEIKLELAENELQKLNELSSKASMTMDEYLETPCVCISMVI